MEPFTRLVSNAVPLAIPNCDTDQIVPGRYLSRKRADGFAGQLFHDLRLTQDEKPRREFVLNNPAYLNARILIADENFGCGSSRESAVWALSDYGFRAVIAASFGDIFFSNCAKNGLLAVKLAPAEVIRMRDACEADANREISIDLSEQTVMLEGMSATFSIDSLRKQMLLSGKDEIRFTLESCDAIEKFESGYDKRYSWL